MSTLDKLRELDAESNTNKQFGPYQEEAIIALALDHPEFFLSVGRFMRPDMFARLECRWIIAEILNQFEKFEVMPTRAMLRDHLIDNMTENDPHETILAIVDKKSDPRDVPILKDTLLKWAKQKAFGLLYEQESMDAFHRGDYQYLDKILNDANRIADIGESGFWFFESYELLFEKTTIEHRTTGFPQLDKLLNNGGPSPKEVVCWMAPTNVGKCHSGQSNILEEQLSCIYEIELENGQIIECQGIREVQTARGIVKVCDLTTEDDIVSIQPQGEWDIQL